MVTNRAWLTSGWSGPLKNAAAQPQVVRPLDRSTKRYFVRPLLIAIYLAICALPRIGLAQELTTPVASAFRSYSHDFHEKVVLVADAMAEEKYSFRATPSAMSFREMVWWLIDYNEYLCGSLAGVRFPRSPGVTSDSPKAALLGRLRQTSQFCATALATLDDSKLSERVDIDLRIDFVGPPPPITRADAIVAVTAAWADLYARLSESLRLNGIVPPKPSGAGKSDPNPASGRAICYTETPGQGGPGFTFTLSGAPYTVTGDGQGAYEFGKSNVIVVAAVRAAVMVLGKTSVDGTPRRSISIDLRDPVVGSGGVPLGVVTDSSEFVEVAAQWHAENDKGGRRRARSVFDIPIGSKVDAAQTDVQFHINGVIHALQMGPQPIGHCFSDPPVVHGRGTTQGTILRADTTTWIVELPPGSIGRLWDVHLGYSHAIDKGLYRVSLRFVLKK